MPARPSDPSSASERLVLQQAPTTGRDRGVFSLGILVLALITALVPWGSAWAQDPGAGAATTVPEETAAEPAPEAVEVPPELASARDTMRTFLEAFDPAKAPEGWNALDRAAFTLDLSALSEDVRRQQGRELAAQLKEVLDKTAYIEIDDLSADPAASPWSLEVSENDRITIAPDEHGRWYFDAATVDAVPALLAEVRGREFVEGVNRSGPLTLAQWIRSKMPPPLLGTAFLAESWQWLGLLFLILVGLSLDRLITSSVRAAIIRYLSKRKETIDTDQIHTSLRPLGLLVAAIVWWLGIFALGLPTQLLQTLAVAVKFVIVVASVWAIYRMVDIVAAVLEVRAQRSENKFDDLLVPLFRKSAKILVAAIGFVFIADNLDVDITSLVAGLGIGGLALALAAQDTVKNLFGSLMVIMDQPFSVGDWVKIGNVEGTVMELGFRSTRIKTFYDSTITLPNANLISASVDNLGARTYRRWSTFLSLTYETPAEKVEAFCEGVRELVRRHPSTRKDNYHVCLNKFSEASIDVMLYIFFETPDWGAELQARHRLALDIMRLAQDLGVDFAYPTQTLFVQRPPAMSPLGELATYGERLPDIFSDAQSRAAAITDGVGSSGPAISKTVGGSSGDG